MRKLDEQWLIYRNACYPKGIPVAQEQECRQAFFAGCLVVLKFAVESCDALQKKKPRNN